MRSQPNCLDVVVVVVVVIIVVIVVIVVALSHADSLIQISGVFSLLLYFR